MRSLAVIFCGVLALLTSCGGGGPPPSVTIISPASDATVSGTAAVQVTLGDEEVSGEINVYARARDSEEEGRLIGSVNTRPYIISWNTTSLPAGDALELYATATVDGATGTSKPVRVVIQNATAPTLEYLVAYNLPAAVIAPQALGTPPLPQGIDIGAIRPALEQPLARIATIPVPPPLKAQAAPDRFLAMEWAWTPVDGAAGYRVLFSPKSIAGPYEVVKNQAASAGTVAQEKFSMFVTDRVVGDRVYGALRSLNTADTPSAMSNAGRAVFLGTQYIVEPLDGEIVRDGRPTLTWTAVPGATGTLYFVCDRPCTADGAKRLWTNYPTFTTAQSASYPIAQKALLPGTYYWWAAGVRMERGHAVSLSYSEQRRLVVP